MPNSPSHRLYENCRVYDPQGTLIFRCDDRRRRWYLSMGLAEASEHGNNIKLTFDPKGPGHSKDPYFLQDFQNRCVVCASEDHLSHHHVVPYCYRRHFPKDTYRYGCWMYDVLLLCIDCHERYEDAAAELKNQIALEHGVDPQGILSLSPSEIRTVKLAAGLLRHGDQMPPPRRLELEAELKKLIHKESITQEDLIQAWQLRLKGRTTPAGFLVVQKLLRQEQTLDGFARRWRVHFMKWMKPAYLPEGWVVDRLIYADTCKDRA